MTTLSIEGQKVKVSDDFLSMTPEQQNAAVEEIAAELKLESGPKHPNMSQVNRGIADSTGGLVDLINPFDGYEFGVSTGSATLGRVSPAGAAVRGVKAAVAPYTKSEGGYRMARRHLQTLAGGRERAEELASQVGGENPLNLTPAQQTQDPNMLGLEQLVASRESAQSAIQAGDVTDAQAFFVQRRAKFARKPQADADSAMSDVNARLNVILSQRTFSVG